MVKSCLICVWKAANHYGHNEFFFIHGLYFFISWALRGERSTLLDRSCNWPLLMLIGEVQLTAHFGNVLFQTQPEFATPNN